MRRIALSDENKSFVRPPLRLVEWMRHGERAIDLSGIRRGDVVRFELDDDHTWFYCNVDEVIGADEIVCTVVETQSWPNLALAGFLPGRPFRMPLERVLSIVR
jgi:hypothetical protein